MPLTAPFELRYGDFAAGGSETDFFLVRRFRILGSPEQYVLEAEVLVVASSGSSFRDRVNELEDAFSLPNQRLRVIHSGNDLTDRPPAGIVAANPSFANTGNPVNSERSRLYAVSVAVSLPSNG